MPKRRFSKKESFRKPKFASLMKIKLVFLKIKFMDWEDKIILVDLGNQAHSSDEDLKKYHEYVLSKIDEFDGQAIDMFIQNTSLIPNDINENKEFYQTVYNKIIELIKNLDDIERLTLRCSLRLEYLNLILKGEMK